MERDPDVRPGGLIVTGLIQDELIPFMHVKGAGNGSILQLTLDFPQALCGKVQRQAERRAMIA
jgi:hypothetical protein